MALTTVPASLSATALTLTTAAQPNITSVGTLTGLTVSGNIAGTLTTAAQPNITSVGTLSGLTVTNPIAGSVTGTAATVTGAAQTNITSLGTLTSLTVDTTVLDSYIIRQNTSDGSDNSQLSLAGGGADSDGRGARARLYGNEHSSKGGDVDISTGNIANAQMDLYATGHFTVDAGGDITLDADGADINFKDGGTLFGQISNASGLYLVSNVSDAPMYFRGNDGGSYVNAITIDYQNGGRVGINRAPSITNSKLEVGGADDVPLINVEASGNTGGLGIGSTGLKLFHGSSAKMTIDSSGNVNIGAKDYHTHQTTVDSLQIGYALNLYEDSYTSGTLNYAVWANNSYYSTSGGNKYMRNDQASRIMQYDGILAFQNAPAGTADNAVTFTDRLNILADGKVGIGDATPDWHFTVEHSRTNDWISRIYNTATNGYGTLIRTDATAANDTIALGVYADSSYKMAVRSTGKVGIGEISPSELLHVKGTNSAIAIDGNGASNTASIKFINDNERSRITSAYDTGGGGRLTFHTDTAGGSLVERMRIDNSGNVLPGADAAQNLGSTSKRWDNLYVNDMHFSNEGSDGNDIDGTTGNWTLQEGEEHLYIINNKSGKKFKFSLEEVQ